MFALKADARNGTRIGESSHGKKITEPVNIRWPGDIEVTREVLWVIVASCCPRGAAVVVEQLQVDGGFCRGFLGDLVSA